MTIKTKYNLGDVVWHFNEHNGEITQLTLGQVEVVIRGKHHREEMYMAHETGLGTGYFYYVKDLFSNKEKAIKAKEKMEQ